MDTLHKGDDDDDDDNDDDDNNNNNNNSCAYRIKELFSFFLLDLT